MFPKKKVLLALSLAFVFSGCGEKSVAQNATPEIPVYTTKAESVPIYEEYIGQIYGSEDISIRARIEGFVQQVHFREGELIEAGDMLYTLESNSQNAKVAEKQSRVAQAQTTLARAKSDLARIKPLAEMNAVSKSELDAAQADFDAARSSVKASKAALASSKVTQGYTVVSSPITGVIGKTRFRTGDLVGSSQDNMILTEVSAVSSVRVEFFISEKLYLKGFRRLVKRRENDEKSGKKIAKQSLTLILADGSEYTEKGYLDFIDRSIDPTTGAILLQATFPNPQGMLRPGLFAKIRVKVRDVKDGILVPQRSVTELQELSQVAVVDEKGVVSMRSITAGNKVGNFWLVEDGLEPGEKIVYEGLQKIREGLTVNPIDTVVSFIDISSLKKAAPKKETEAK
jgi:membrane fusion protein (multidrug efflux system)